MSSKTFAKSLSKYSPFFLLEYFTAVSRPCFFQIYKKKRCLRARSSDFLNSASAPCAAVLSAPSSILAIIPLATSIPFCKGTIIFSNASHCWKNQRENAVNENQLFRKVLFFFQTKIFTIICVRVSVCQMHDPFMTGIYNREHPRPYTCD
jgi:hypothetical protein